MLTSARQRILQRTAATLTWSPVDSDGEPSDTDPGVVTVEMKTTFMRPTPGTLIARGKLLHQTRSFAFTEGGIYNDAGHLLAHATGTFKFVRPPKAPTP